MRKYVGESTHLIFDGTRLACYSKEVDLARIGYNHSQIWDPAGQSHVLLFAAPGEGMLRSYFMPFAQTSPTSATFSPV